MTTLDIKALRTHEVLHPTKPFPISDAPPLADATGTTTGLSASLPTAPNDGDTADMLVDAANGVLWRFRYVAARIAVNPWMFVGGAPLTATITTSETSASTTLGDLATVGPSIIVPRTGLYIVGTASGISNNTAADGGIAVPMSPTLTAANANGFAAVSIGPGTSGTARGSNFTVPVALTGGETLKLQYAAISGGTATFQFRRVSILPVSVT